MYNIPLFNGIKPNEINAMMNCFHPENKKFAKGQTIMSYTKHIDNIGVLVSGKAHMYCIDYSGEYSLLERFESNDIFGEIFLVPLNSLGYIIEADTVCEVMFIPYSDIIKRCSNACKHHSLLVSNLMHMTAKKAQSLTLHINLISKKTVRRKITAYLEYMRDKHNSNTFKIDSSFSQLADYLCVDRTSLMRELKYMREEGIIQNKGRFITLL